ncbi:hypothetical protein PAAG_07823 [Paracoccidioides lutzii Pb01]|uniref:Uncharacterized protein n=1 Tax=Paracoccidioides lutzii (strain ATCC MYA-826 / Pb01) TaxID=502779 RepID=C1HA94_PARBA|nr:hypothetical protein PAAG_07823 [Paracoccidioides lutzii Pb01]EEH37267.2 hypothetical protein PAAG_07823 [Paracoccidioides lutzii Pb01]
MKVANNGNNGVFSSSPAIRPDPLLLTDSIRPSFQREDLTMVESRILSSNQASSQTRVSLTASTQRLRQRSLSRSVVTTFSEPSSSPPGLGRLPRSSTFSDTVSEARQSIKFSTDDLFFPRVDSRTTPLAHDNESHWQSIPLALALLPAVWGLLFNNGSAIATDMTLLVLAAIFLNWSIRLPWDWYSSAQELNPGLPQEVASDMDLTIEDPESELNNDEEENKEHKHSSTSSPTTQPPQSEVAKAAAKELRRHELAALASCFLFPTIGAWLLHQLRLQLSRPSEGLVSNYNLTVFLLAAEIRPFSHLLKMVQARTLYLQRLVATSNTENRHERIDASKIHDFSTRLGELEVHIAKFAARKHQHQHQHHYHFNHQRQSQSQPQLQPQQSPDSPINDPQAPITSTPNPPDQIPADLSALTRAMRRYEKRTTQYALATEARLQSLEKRLNDVIALNASTAQQLKSTPIPTSATTTKRKTTTATVTALAAAAPHRLSLLTLLNWLYGMVMLPARALLGLMYLPYRVVGQGVGCVYARWAGSSSGVIVVEEAEDKGKGKGLGGGTNAGKLGGVITRRKGGSGGRSSCSGTVIITDGRAGLRRPSLSALISVLSGYGACNSDYYFHGWCW